MIATGTPRAGRWEDRAAPSIDDREIGVAVREIVNRWPAVGLAVGVVRNGRLESFYGHGCADIRSNRPITQDTVFRIASISKTFTAIAVMQLWENGLVDLDAPASDYLRAYRLIPPTQSSRPATVRDLLTHTAGVPEELHLSDVFDPDFGESIRAGRRLPTLAEFYGDGIHLSAEPGARYVYSDHGFATLGQMVEDVSGEPFDAYLREHVFGPLGMADTDLVRSERVRSGLATGYTLRSDGPRPVTDREWVTAGASSIYSTPRDMAGYVAALVGGGANEHGRVLDQATLATMFEPQYQPDPRVPGVGLAFSRFILGGHLAVEHGGILPGFNSQIFAAPDDGVGVIAFTNGSRRAMLWLPAEVSGLLKRLLCVPDDVIRSDIPQHPEIWGDICGWYQLSARPTDVRARLMLGAGVEVFVRGGGLMVRALTPVPALYRGFALHPDDSSDPYVFRIDLSEYGVGTARVVFGREPGVGTTSIHLDLMPLTLRKRSAGTNPRRWAAGLLGAAGVASAAVVVRRRGGKG